jgi:hypothetical protein
LLTGIFVQGLYHGTKIRVIFYFYFINIKTKPKTKPENQAKAKKAKPETQPSQKPSEANPIQAEQATRVSINRYWVKIN